MFGDMQIFVKPTRGKRATLDVNVVDTIASVKAASQRIFDARICYMRLSFAGEQLEDGRTLSSYNIQPRSVLKLAVVGGVLEGVGLCSEDELFGDGSLPSVGHAARALHPRLRALPSSSSSSSVSSLSSSVSSSSKGKGKGKSDFVAALSVFKRKSP